MIDGTKIQSLGLLQNMVLILRANGLDITGVHLMVEAHTRHICSQCRQEEQCFMKQIKVQEHHLPVIM